jgi:hypothetical protein
VSRRHLTPRFAFRSADVGRRLDVFMVVAVASVLGNRIFLVITGYPQLGNGTLHISHAIWGALMMAIAIVISISFLGPFGRVIASFLGGAGFGWFIDELGKFITRDVNYFFEPTFAIIYCVFIVMYLVFRAVERRPFQPAEGLLNAIEALKSAALGQLDEPERREVLELFDRTKPQGALAASVRSVLADAPTLPPSEPSRSARTASNARAAYREVTSHPRFPTIVDLLFIALALSAVAEVVLLGLDGEGLVTFTERLGFVAALVSTTLIVIGVFVLHRSRPAAYKWFDRGLLVQIFVVQIFVFAEEQLTGTIGLVITLVAWALLQGAMRAEREREALGLPHDAPTG